MNTKKFILYLVAIIGVTLVAVTFFKCVTEVQTKRYEAKNFEPLCEHRSYPRHQHYYRPYCPHPNQYRRPHPVKIYFEYIPPPPRRHKIKRRRRTRNTC